MIYFLSMTLASQVHMQVHGFTSYLNLYAWGDTPQEAEANGRAYLLGNGVVVKKFHDTSVALQQDPTHYTFPEQIYGLPEKAAIAAITSRGYPESIVNSTLATLRKKLAQLRDGRMRLADLATA